jgi:hypothetical protein
MPISFEEDTVRKAQLPQDPRDAEECGTQLDHQRLQGCCQASPSPNIRNCDTRALKFSHWVFRAALM